MHASGGSVNRTAGHIESTVTIVSTIFQDHITFAGDNAFTFEVSGSFNGEGLALVDDDLTAINNIEILDRDGFAVAGGNHIKHKRCAGINSETLDRGGDCRIIDKRICKVVNNQSCAVNNAELALSIVVFQF